MTHHENCDCRCGLDFRTNWAGTYLACGNLLTTANGQSVYSNIDLTLNIIPISKGIYAISYTIDNVTRTLQVLAIINASCQPALQGTGPNGEPFFLTATRVKDCDVKRFQASFTELSEDVKIDFFGIFNYTHKC